MQDYAKLLNALKILKLKSPPFSFRTPAPSIPIDEDERYTLFLLLEAIYYGPELVKSPELSSVPPEIMEILHKLKDDVFEPYSASLPLNADSSMLYVAISIIVQFWQHACPRNKRQLLKFQRRANPHKVMSKKWVRLVLGLRPSMHTTWRTRLFLEELSEPVRDLTVLEIPEGLSLEDEQALRDRHEKRTRRLLEMQEASKNKKKDEEPVYADEQP